MLKKPQCPVIAIEEHYSDAELYAQRYGANKVPTVVLFDREGRRVVSLSGEQRAEALLTALSAADE